MAPRHKKKRKAQASSAPAAEKKRDWLVGDLVVAKLKGHRPWPAQIQRPEDYGYEARPAKVFVTFFGTEETCFCTQNKITPFTAAMRKTMADQLQKLNTNPKLENAIKEIFAADDEQKVSMRSRNNSDDEKSEEEEEHQQPPEPSSKPPRKRAKLAAREAAAEVVVVQEPLVHSRARNESSRPMRTAGTATAASARSLKQERVAASVAAAHQVHKLPRKVRIKVTSTQSSDSAASLPEGTAVGTDKESSSPQSSFKTEPDSPEKKTEITSPQTAAQGSNNEDVDMEEATADADACHPSEDARTSDTEVAKKSNEPSSPKASAAEISDNSMADEGDDAKTEIDEDELTAQEVIKDTETAVTIEGAADAEHNVEAPASTREEQSEFVEYHEERRNDGAGKTLEESRDDTKERASEEEEKDTNTEIDAPSKTAIEKAADDEYAEAKVEVPTPVTIEKQSKSIEYRKEETGDGSGRAIQEAADVPKESSSHEAEKESETETALEKVTDGEPNVEVTSPSLVKDQMEQLSNAVEDEQGTGRLVTGETLHTTDDDHAMPREAEKESSGSKVIRIEVDAPSKIEAETTPSNEIPTETRAEVVEEQAVPEEARKDFERTALATEIDPPPKSEEETLAVKGMETDCKVVEAAAAASSVEELSNVIEEKQEAGDVTEAEKKKEDTDSIAVSMEIDAPSNTDAVKETDGAEVKVAEVAASSIEGDHVEKPSIPMENEDEKETDAPEVTVAEVAPSSVDEHHVEKSSIAMENEDETIRIIGEALNVAEERAVLEANNDSERSTVLMEIDAPSNPCIEVAKEIDADAKVEFPTAASSVDKEHLENRSNMVERAVHRVSATPPVQSVEEEKVQSNDRDSNLVEDEEAGKPADPRSEDPEVSVQSVVEETREITVEAEGAQDKDPGDNIAQPDASTAHEKELKVSDSAAVPNEVDDHAMTETEEEERPERKDCQPAFADGVELETGSVETRDEDTAAPAADVDTACGSAAENNKEGPAGEGTTTADEKSQQEASEPVASFEDDMQVDTNSSLSADLTANEAPAVTEETTNHSHSLTTTTVVVGGDGNDSSLQENVQNIDEDRGPLATVESTPDDIQQEKEENEEAPRAAGDVETTQVKDEAENVESTLSEKSMEEESEVTVVSISVEQVVEKEREKDDSEGTPADKIVVEDGEKNNVADAVTQDHQIPEDAPAAD